MNTNTYSRKDFITLLGLGTASLAFSKWNTKDNAGYIAPIAFQLYTVRREIEKDLDREPKMFFEIDTYWVKTSGQNPAKGVKDFGARAPFLHIKDGPATKGEKAYRQVPVGSGTMDFLSIVQAGGKIRNG